MSDRRPVPPSSRHRRSRQGRHGAFAAGLLLAVDPAAAQTTPDPDATVLKEVVVTGRRGGVPDYERPFGPTVLGPAQLDTAPQRRLDEALRSVPGFGLFRRSGSRTANPTAQGVSLRGLGPNGAGRTLVLVDGVPVNDPFGGWVYWSRLPTGAAERVVITRGGGAGPWGNAALAGTVRIETRLPTGISGEVSAGSDDSYQIIGRAGGKAGPLDLGLSASAFSTGGTPLVRRDRRGPIDRDADADSYWADAVAGATLGSVRATARISGFREHRGNGTPYTENATEALDGSLRLVGEGTIDWEAVLYARDWRFESTFSSVTAARTAETPSLDQHDVPSTAYGGVVQLGFSPAAGHQTDIGTDLRWTEGETREFFQFQSGAFRRDRTAGGNQTVAGLFVEHAWTARPDLLLTAGGRLDHWRNRDGKRVEVNRDTGAVTRDTRFADRDGTVLNGRLGLDWQASPSLTLRGAAYTGFRLPTLNELYRPFRVGNDITEANPDLGPERLTGGEIGLRLTPAPGVRLSAALFRAVLENAVDNVTLQTTPGLNPATGVTVPAGGSLAQRLGLDRVVVDGIEAELRLDPGERVSLGLSYLFSDGEIDKASVNPALEGNRPGQSPRHQGTADLTWYPLEPAVLRLQVRAASRSYEDSDNTGTLAPYVVADLYAGWDLTQALHLFGTVENLSGRHIETGRRSDGLVNIGPGRQWQIGARMRW
ncbi:TonB-dependent receptor plug domain-containing protein [Oleisolibacter albus]|uniref:TonB-dependent receptor plug domain-containing protein n=1 Tax=Oleisolibacter albus TaxID=2171757 RepID=UPI001390692E|nr:TonB-dependent receptor [Oleisolibacter albus]